jgi:hypothetical protein
MEPRPERLVSLKVTNGSSHVGGLSGRQHVVRDGTKKSAQIDVIS